MGRVDIEEMGLWHRASRDLDIVIAPPVIVHVQ
jgi:hypothetical protein